MLLSVDLGAELKKSWLGWCELRNLAPAAALRSLIETTLHEGLDLDAKPREPAPTFRVAPVADHGPKLDCRVYFTPSEHQGLLAACETQGHGLQEYVIAAVRAALTQSPNYGQAELEVLARSNAELATIRLVLTSLRVATNDFDLAARITTLQNDIRKHVEHVSAAMANGVRRWQIKV